MEQQSTQQKKRSQSFSEPSNCSKMLKKSVEILKTQYGDVNFCFDCDGDVVKLPAHKGVLSASSPVFNAMFNGELKEKGDVDIEDASPVVFEKFLHFFYGKPMQLSMGNVADVLKLADKYDVEDCLSICVDFLKESSTIDDAVWTLHLALQFQLKDFEMHCLDRIQKNFAKVWSLFDVKDDGAVQLLLNPDDRFLSEKDVERVFQPIFAMSKNMISKITQVDDSRDGCVFSYALVKEKDKQTKAMFTNYEVIRFKLTDGSLMLTDLFCSFVFYRSNGIFSLTNFGFEIRFEERYSFFTSTVHSQKVESCKHAENHVKLTKPIHIFQDRTYFIIMTPTNSFYGNYYTNKVELPVQPVELTPTVKISFPYRQTIEKKCTFSLISRLNFTSLTPE